MSDTKRQEAKKHFEKVMTSQVSDSVKRMNKLMEAWSDHLIGYIMAREALLLLNKIKMLAPEGYGKAVADMDRDALLNGRGFCCEPECYGRLSYERSKHPVKIWDLLDSYCPDCAVRIQKENEQDDLDDDFENELENEDFAD